MAVKKTPGKKRILLVEDHPLVREGLAGLISQEDDLEICGEASGMAEALGIIERAKPDLIVVDLSLDDGSGIDLIKQVKSRWDSIKMLVASMHDESLYAERVLRAGASGYISKKEAADKVVEGIRGVLAGKIVVSEAVADRLLTTLTQSGGDAKDDPITALSDREMMVFRLIGEGQTTRAIADQLNLSVKTIETYRENIKHKLNLKSGTELTRYAVQWVIEN